MRSFLSALAFLTAIPIRTDSLTATDFTHASRWFAWVGLCLGALLVCADTLLRHLLSDGVAAVLLLVLWIALTGALHWDGFLDACDALFASVPIPRRLEILKDVHIGAYGLVGGGLLLLLYVATLVEMPPPQRGVALLVAPIAARWLMTVAQQQFPYLRTSGLGQLVPAQPLTLLWGAIPLLTLFLGGWGMVLRVVLALLLGYGVARWMARQLGGGLTGDCYGAICEITQAIILVLCCI